MLADLFLKLNSPLEPLPTGLDPKLPKLEPIEAVIFDIYGTLVLSGTGDIGVAQTIDREEALRSTLQTVGVAPDPDLPLSDIFYGLIRADHEAAKSQGILYPEVDILDIWKRLFTSLGMVLPAAKDLKVLAIHFECAVNPVWPMPGMEKLLGDLRSKKIPIGIVSNAQFYTPFMLEGFTSRSLEALGFQKDLSLWSYRERLGKPSVELFEKLCFAMAARGIKPEQALYVGNDMLNDIWAASQVGLRTGLFAGDRRSLRLRETDARCRDIEPDVILTALAQLWEVI